METLDQAEDAVEEIEDLPQIEDEETEDEDITEPNESDETEEESEDDEFEEVEIDGETYNLPKSLKDKVMKNADYTQKTQTLAEERKQLEAERESLQTIQQRNQQQFDKKAELHIIDKQLEEYGKVDWATLQQQDTNLAQQHQFQYMQLQNQRSKLNEELEKIEQDDLQAQQSMIAKQREEINAKLTSTIDGWSEEKSTQVLNKAKELGFNDRFINYVAQGAFPEAVPMVAAVHKAMLYDQMLEKAKQAKKKVVEVKPSKKVTGKKTNKPDIYDPKLTTEQRVALFRKQKAKN